MKGKKKTMKAKQKQVTPFLETLRKTWGIETETVQETVDTSPRSTDIYDALPRGTVKPRPRSEWPY